MSSILSSYILKSTTIKNRVVVPPMVSSFIKDEECSDGLINQRRFEHYRKLIEGGAGIIIFEALSVKSDNRISKTQLGIWSDDHIPSLNSVSQFADKHDTKILAQIMYTGFPTNIPFEKPQLAPSDFFKDGKQVGISMSIDDIKDMQRCFLEASIRVKKAGFEGIELHGAHGYLLSQFASPLINRREDQYGGSIENRMRFGVEIIDMIRKELGDNFIIGYRMGGNEPTIDEGREIAKILEKSGVDLIHVSSGFRSKEYPELPEDFPLSRLAYLGTEIKKVVDIPVVVVGSIKEVRDAKYILENQLADFVAVGRAHVADYNWSRKIIDGEDITPCLSCSGGCVFAMNKCPHHR